MPGIMPGGFLRSVGMRLRIFGRGDGVVFVGSVVVGPLLASLHFSLAGSFLSSGVLRGFDGLLLGASYSFGFRFFCGLSLAIEFGDRLLRVFDQAVMRIAVQKLLESSPGLLGII